MREISIFFGLENSKFERIDIGKKNYKLIRKTTFFKNHKEKS
jgi:hypothetical protein